VAVSSAAAAASQEQTAGLPALEKKPLDQNPFGNLAIYFRALNFA